MTAPFFPSASEPIPAPASPPPPTIIADFVLVRCFTCLRCIAVYFFFQAEDGIRDLYVTGVQTCALPISGRRIAALDELVGAEGFADGVCPLEDRGVVAHSRGLQKRLQLRGAEVDRALGDGQALFELVAAEYRVCLDFCSPALDRRGERCDSCDFSLGGQVDDLLRCLGGELQLLRDRGELRGLIRIQLNALGRGERVLGRGLV